MHPNNTRRGRKDQCTSRVRNDLTRGEEAIEISRVEPDRVGSGRVGSGRARSGFKLSRVGSGRLTLTRPDPTRPARFYPTHERPWQTTSHPTPSDPRSLLQPSAYLHDPHLSERVDGEAREVERRRVRGDVKAVDRPPLSPLLHHRAEVSADQGTHHRLQQQPLRPAFRFFFGFLGFWFAGWFVFFWSGLVWSGLAWPGLVWPGLAWPGLVWSGLIWSGFICVAVRFHPGLVWYFAILCFASLCLASLLSLLRPRSWRPTRYLQSSGIHFRVHSVPSQPTINGGP